MEGHRDLVIGSTERSWSIDAPFEHFVQKYPTRSCKIGQNSQNSGFSRLVRDRTFERRFIVSSEILENDFGGVGACSCSLNTCYHDNNHAFFFSKEAARISSV